MKTNKRIPTVACLFASAGFAGCSTIGNPFDRESKIGADEVPAIVRSAALLEVPDFVLESAEVEKSRRQPSEFELHGHAGGRDCRIHVDREGTVRSVEYFRVDGN